MAARATTMTVWSIRTSFGETNCRRAYAQRPPPGWGPSTHRRCNQPPELSRGAPYTPLGDAVSGTLWPDRPHPVACRIARDQVHVEVEHRLGCRCTSRMDDVHPIGEVLVPQQVAHLAHRLE